jgi:hypothetical protein
MKQNRGCKVEQQKLDEQPMKQRLDQIKISDEKYKRPGCECG